MIMNFQGFGHFTRGVNNQDLGIETQRMLLVLDGCCGAKYSEVGTRLFGQLFSRKEDFYNLENFEDNVKAIFEELIKMIKKYCPESEYLKQNCIMENLLFTIIACFETDSEYIVKLFGDGYIITQNNRGSVSYMNFPYGKYPPYFVYKHCSIAEFKNAEFKTFRFDKKKFPKVLIATDGILPIGKGEINDIDRAIADENRLLIQMNIKNQRQSFNDDVTIGMFGCK